VAAVAVAVAAVAAAAAATRSCGSVAPEAAMVFLPAFVRPVNFYMVVDGKSGKSCDC
jgi:hypothetical protein